MERTRKRFPEVPVILRPYLPDHETDGLLPQSKTGSSFRNLLLLISDLNFYFAFEVEDAVYISFSLLTSIQTACP